MPGFKKSVYLVLLCSAVLHVHAASGDGKPIAATENPLYALYAPYGTAPAALRRPPILPHHRRRAAGGAGAATEAAVTAVTTTPARRAPPLGEIRTGHDNPLRRAVMYRSASTHSSHHGPDSMGHENVFLSSIVEGAFEAASECTHKGILDTVKFVPKLEAIYADAIEKQAVPEQIKTCRLLLAEIHLYAIDRLKDSRIGLIEPGQAMIFVAFIHMKLDELEFAH